MTTRNFDVDTDRLNKKESLSKLPLTFLGFLEREKEKQKIKLPLNKLKQIFKSLGKIFFISISLLTFSERDDGGGEEVQVREQSLSF